MNVSEIAFTLLPVLNLEKARHFYEEVVGLKPSHVFLKEGMGMVEYDIGQATLTIGAGNPFFKPQAAGAVALEMADFGAAVDEFKKHGTRFVLQPIETPVCHMAIIADPDGNQIILHKRKART